MEKFKFANVINGKEFFRYYAIQSNTVFVNPDTPKGTLIESSYLSKEKLLKTFHTDFDKYIKDYISTIPLLNFNLPALHTDLYFCKKCIAEGFHSMYHQTIIIKNCPYHPSEVLTNKCPFCKSIFRKFNLGYKEDAFCCKNCKRNILKNIQFRVISTKWKNKHDIYDPLINRLVSHIPKDKKLYFIFPIKISANNLKNINTTLIPQLFDNITFKCFVPISYNNNSSFQLQYPQRGQTKSSYYLRSLIAEDPEQDLRSLRYLSEHFIRVKLNLELFKQSKAIMKSVERFILKQLDKKTRTEIKRAYNKYGYNSSENITGPFIDWKNRCYEDWLYNAKLGRNYPSFNFKRHDYYSQIFPSFNNEEKFQSDLHYFLRRVESYSLLTNIFSKLLFSYLYASFLELNNDYSENHIFINPSVFILTEVENTVKDIKFICNYSKIL
ncbi:hypothetical protein MKY80_11525 [Lysinibacillus sp. FSL R5-0849]|uniref:hypothetical protein n=1 Tax=Lysinibacillus sp. FSL R5-0849 TaxID=2921660 RepID=UPI00315A11EB